MNVIELIEQLEAIRETHGDLDVGFDNFSHSTGKPHEAQFAGIIRDAAGTAKSVLIGTSEKSFRAASEPTTNEYSADEMDERRTLNQTWAENDIDPSLASSLVTGEVVSV